MDSIIHLSPREAFEYLKNDTAILDIRPEYETSYRVLDVPNAFFLPYNSYQDNLDKIPKDIRLVVVDSVGNRSTEVARYLIEQGYPQVVCLAGGIVAWDHVGLPIKKDVGYEMVGGCACRLHPQKDG
ncbi:MAG TPA: rhodanese-like domain-containing protein [Clostridia bacterium]|nr:rhodanese-like domain-containing protein [Clostridia bacterium]